eukprot:GILI01023611.1.p1 GENE.GILI01023611.1~~GILI01023611.1.p1  ORF type:complete len:433 (+),score=68.72 GILI01023611.1:38-1336(+)
MSTAAKPIQYSEVNGNETYSCEWPKRTSKSVTASSSSSATTLLSSSTALRKRLNRLIAPLMPEGYPQSVSPDYGDYQYWDTLQCLCSSVTGTLSTRAVLMGVGVGHAEATALSGTFSWLIRDVTSKVGAVWFAAYHATDLDNDAKRWRFVADLTNDTALFLEIFSVHLPQAYFLICVCIASLFKAVCGVAGGSSRASLTQHFSIRHNMADVAAKDGSQETVASLIGMFLGMLVAWFIPETNFNGTVVGFVFFTGMHLWTNYRAVSSLVLTHFNRHRARYCISNYLRGQEVPGCLEANQKEAILFGREPFTITNGARPSAALHGLSDAVASIALRHLAEAKEGQRFVVVANMNASRFDVLFAEGAEEEALWAYYVICKTSSAPHASPSSDGQTILLPSEADGYLKFREQAQAAGWDLSKLQFRVMDWRLKRND